jgi:hypothetical protein
MSGKTRFIGGMMFCTGWAFGAIVIAILDGPLTTGTVLVTVITIIVLVIATILQAKKDIDEEIAAIERGG